MAAEKTEEKIGCSKYGNSFAFEKQAWTKSKVTDRKKFYGSRHGSEVKKKGGKPKKKYVRWGYK